MVERVNAPVRQSHAHRVKNLGVVGHMGQQGQSISQASLGTERDAGIGYRVYGEERRRGRRETETRDE